MKVLDCIKNEKGSILVIYALMVTVLLGFGAIVVDVGCIAVEKQNFQNAVDSASLAAVSELPDTCDAVRVAQDYLEANGYDISDVVITFKDNNKTIVINGAMEIESFFGKVLNFGSTTVYPSASATGGIMGGVFNYSLFSGSTSQRLIINGEGTDITGSTHTNSGFILNGSNSTITGACEAVEEITINGSGHDIGLEVSGAPFIEMPDFSEEIRQQAENIGIVYNSNKVFNGCQSITSSIYVNGELNVNSSRFSGTGCILAKDSIVFDGSSLYNSPGDAVCFYSKEGNIIFNGADSEIHGVIYAPNGTVIFNGSNQVVYGRVIANNIIFNGQCLTVIGADDDLKSLPSTGARLIK